MLKLIELLMSFLIHITWESDSYNELLYHIKFVLKAK